MGENITITVDMDKKCPECGKGGAANNGFCLRCVTKMISGKPMRTDVGRNAQARMRQSLDEARRNRR